MMTVSDPVPAVVQITIEDYRQNEADRDLADLLFHLSGVHRDDCIFLELRNGAWQFQVYVRDDNGRIWLGPSGLGPICHTIRWSLS